MQQPSTSKVSKMQNNARQSQGSLMGLHGAVYQLKLFVLFLHRGVSRGYSFRLGTEIKEAKKFDDIVFEYTIDGKKKYRFVQAKHKSDDSKKITRDSLLNESDGDYSLVKYFFSYTDSKKEKLFKNDSITDVTVCTNIDFENLDFIDQMGDQDDLLDVKIQTKRPKRYKFSQNIVPLLKSKLQNYNLTRLARRLAECFLENISIKHHDDKDIFKSYHLVLAEEVIDIDTKRFHDKFVKWDKSLSENAEQFRQLFQVELNRILKSLDTNLNIKDLNNAIEEKRKIVNNKQVGLNVSKKFGIGERPKVWPKNAISDDEITDFLNHLVFAVNQPNQEDLDEILRYEIGEEFGFDYITNETVYNRLFHKILNWLLSKDRDRFLEAAEGKIFFENARKIIPIWFGIREPVDSFTGRLAELKELHTLLQTGCNRTTAILHIASASITGLGGIGKSELARMYINLHSEDYDNKIIWINAETYESLSQSFKRLAGDTLRMKMKDREEKPKDIETIVEDVYRFFSRGKCLFVFDNAEKRRTEDSKDGGINMFLPPLPSNVNKPYVLITSRNQNWENIGVLSLDVFTENEAINFIRKTLKIKDDSQEQEIGELAELMQYLPLALQQAVAYIKKKDVALKNIGSKFDIRAYIKRYENETKTLLDFNFPDDSSDLYTKTTYTTWKITIDKIKDHPECGREAEEILQSIAYFDADNINVRIFLPIVNNDEEKLASAIELLRQYSMINLGQEPGIVNVHRLVQQVIRVHLKDKDRDERMFKKAFELLMAFFPLGEKLEDYAKRRLLQQHLETLLSHVDYWSPKDDKLFEWKERYATDLLLSMTHCDFDNPHRKEELVKRAVHLIETCKGPKHFDVRKLLIYLGCIYRSLDNPCNRKELFDWAIPILLDHINGSWDLETATALSDLGICYDSIGYSRTAEKLLHLALNLMEKMYGPDHPEVCAVLTSLSYTYWSLGDIHKQRQFIERALIIIEKHYGRDHFYVAGGLVTLSKSYAAFGEYQEPKPLLKRALRIYEKHFGPDNFEVAITLVNLGAIYGALNNHQRKMELFDRALPILVKHFYNEDIVMVIKLLADTYLAKQKEEEKIAFIPVGEMAFSGFEKHYGLKHKMLVCMTLKPNTTYPTLCRSSPSFLN